MDRSQVEEKKRLLAKRREETEAQLRNSEQRLKKLQEEQSSLRGEVHLGRQALADLETYEEQLREESRLVELGEARAAFEQAAEARGAASAAAAAAARELRTTLEQLAASRTQLEDARAALETLEPGATPHLEPETSSFDDEWHALAPLLEQELNARLDMQVVAAAAESSNPRDVFSLPQHLQVLVRARREELRRQSLEESRGGKHKWR